jgi:hypothetical protein
MAQTTGQRYAVERVKPPEALIKVGNPIFSWLLRSPLRGFIGGHLMLLHFRGRKTGRCYKVVAGRRTIDGQLGVLTNSAWRTNVWYSARVEVTLASQRRPGHAEVVEDPEEVAHVYRGLIEEYAFEQAGRRLGIRINANRMPKHEELVDLVVGMAMTGHIVVGALFALLAPQFLRRLIHLRRR